jgi:periplasmic divalent cation tolerance protein
VTASAEPPACLVLTTLAATADAAALARTLVEERLAACVNVLGGVTSVYAWKGAVEQDAEQQLVIKTTPSLVPALEARLRQLHPYEVPEFLVLNVSAGGEAYLAWLRQSVQSPG